MRRLLRSALILACGVAPSLLVAADGAAAGKSSPAIADSAAAPSLKTRARRFPPLTSARAAFEQEREVSLVDEVLRASGTIAFHAPASMRLELTAPEAMTIVVDGDTLTVLDAKGRPIAVPAEFSGFGRFGRVLTDLMLGGKGPEQFKEEWHGADAVTLRTDDAASPFSEIGLRFPPDGPLPTEIVLHERGGDRTTIRMRPLPEGGATAGPAASARTRGSA